MGKKTVVRLTKSKVKYFHLCWSSGSPSTVTLQQKRKPGPSIYSKRHEINHTLNPPVSLNGYKNEAKPPSLGQIGNTAVVMVKGFHIKNHNILLRAL